jgi:AcrR family transcriptional regulator
MSPAVRARSWQQDPAGRRERILTAAEAEFGRLGFRAARVDRIAREAGVSEGTVYYQFGSKDGLLSAVGERYGSALAEAAFGNLDAADVGQIVERMFAFVRKTEGPLAALLLSFDPLEGTAAADANRDQVIARVEQLVRGAPGFAKRPRRRDARIAAEIQFGLVESALRDCFLRDAGRREAAYVREVTRCLEAYLRS